ncbi:hypothetical protein EIP86_004488 [Pleurotus ostreatoroseus]|nr:hypothetical protein EIP86_004488 [Pleurotus ostreatoroseus]
MYSDCECFHVIVNWYNEESRRIGAERIQKITVECHENECATRELVGEGQVLPFPNLHTFHCDTHSGVHLSALRPISRQLKDLRLPIFPACQPDYFADLATFDKLETLRLRVHHHEADAELASPNLDLVPQPIVFSHTVTTFRIGDRSWDTGSRSWLAAQIPRLSFPNLRVLDLWYIPPPAKPYFEFIRRHPTLREAAIYFIPMRKKKLPSLYGLISLIEGRWHPLNEDADSAFTFEDDPAIENLSARTIDVDELARHVALRGFAFSLGPRELGTVTETNSVTALALDVIGIYKLQDDIWDATVPRLCTLTSIKFKHVQELRIKTGTVIPTLSARCMLRSWDDEMKQIAARLRRHPQLRKLALEWRIDPDGWRWSKKDNPTDFISRSDCLRRVNGLIMQYGRWDVPSSPAELGRLFNPETWAYTKRALQKVLPGEEIDINDPKLIMRGWRARNEELVARGMRMLAEACPTLEEIEWYIPQEWRNSPAHTGWVWKVSRDKKGAVTSVTSKDFWYPGCGYKSIYDMDISVGQELEFQRGERIRCQQEWHYYKRYQFE